MEKKNKDMCILGKEAYESKVALEALNRAGKCPQLKGHVHEILYKDSYNTNLKHLLEGKHAALTKSNTAQMKDIVVMKGSKVVGHAQLKDTISPGGVAKTIKQINSGHYNKTRVLGTEETVQKIGAKVNQKVSSSGISSNTTKRIADKALGKMPTVGAVGNALKSGGTSGAILGAGIETVTSIYDVATGEKDLDDAVIDVAAAGVRGGVVGAASSAAGAVAAGAAGTAVSAVAGTAAGTAIAGTAVGAAAVAAAPVVIGFAAACAVGSFISSLFDD